MPLYLFLCTILLGCAQEFGSAELIQQTDSFQLSDNGRVGKNILLRAGGDDRLQLLTIPNTVLELDLKNKKVACILDSLHFNVDSLIGCTYQKHNEGKLLYSKHSAAELANADKSLFQIYSVCEEDSRLYIPVTITAEATYLSAEQVKKNLNSSSVNIDSLLQLTAATNIRSIDFLYFMLVTDLQFNIVSIKALYGLEPQSESILMPAKGCFVFDRKFYSPMVSTTVSGLLYDSVSIENHEPPYYFRSFNIQHPEQTEDLISKALVDGKQISLKNHITQELPFCVYKNHLISVVGNQLLMVSSNKIMERQPSLPANNQIIDMSAFGDVIYFVVAESRQLPPSEISKRQFGTSTELSALYLMRYDPEKGSITGKSVLNKNYVHRLYKNVLYTVSPGIKKSPVVFISKLK